MNKALEESLNSEKDIFYNVERSLGVHLGVADKFNLISHLREYNHTSFIDLFFDSANYLWQMGYRSESLKKFTKSKEANEHRLAELFEEVIQDPEKLKILKTSNSTFFSAHL